MEEAPSPRFHPHLADSGLGKRTTSVGGNIHTCKKAIFLVLFWNRRKRGCHKVFLLQPLSYTLIHQHSCELSDKSRQGFPGWEGALFSSYSSPIRRLGGLHIPEQRCKGGRLLLVRPSPFSTLPASHLEFHSTKLCKAASDPTKTISVPPLVLWGRAGYGVG